MELYEEIASNLSMRKKMEIDGFCIGKCPFCNGKGFLTFADNDKRDCIGCLGLGFGWIKGGGICYYR